MTRREYFKSLFPKGNERAFQYIHIMCCKDLGLTDTCKDFYCGCKECWEEDYQKTLPDFFTQPLLDKFMKLW